MICNLKTIALSLAFASITFSASFADSVKFGVVGQSGGFRASVVHEGNGSGDTTDQASSSAVSGDFADGTPPGFGLTGDWVNHDGGGVLTVDGGALVASAGGFDAFGAASNIRIRWTGGQLKFFNAADTDFGPGFVGGFLNFAFDLDTNGDDVFDDIGVETGTFFFYPKDFANASPGPDPNKWDDDAAGLTEAKRLSLWGNNWNTTSHTWDFLDDEEGLSFSDDNSFPDFSDDGGATLASDFIAAGTDLSFVRLEGDTPGVPEPTTFLMWSVLGVAGLVVTKRRRKK